MKCLKENRYLLLTMLGVWLFLIFEHIAYEVKNLFTMFSLLNKLLVTTLLFTLFIIMGKSKEEKEDDKKRKEDLELENEIKKGIDKEQFEVYYQPKINVLNKELEFEALMRWNHPSKGLIGPNVFIPASEKSLLIKDLTFYLIDRVKRDIKKLKRPVSLNISPIHFNEKDFFERIAKRYKKLSYISFELTEGSLIGNLEESTEKIEKLRKYGVEFLIDDFGTGYSSLSYLSKLPIKTLKVDRSFVVNMFEKKENLKIMKAIIDLGKGLNLEVVVEGVEQENEIAILREMGIDVFQGYYFGKPERLEDVLKKIEHNIYTKRII